MVKADPGRLAQIISNLLTNAARYTEQGGKIWLTAAGDGDDVIITVKDTGIGIPTEKLETIFEMFAQVDRSSEGGQSGLGIGLMLVKRLTEMHGGTVDARSEGLGNGSEFILRLPIVSNEPQTQPASNEAVRRSRLVDLIDNLSFPAI